jgi:hypothetical protein
MVNNKIGIFVHGQHGDIALCTCILKYKEILWPGKDIVWFLNLSPEKATYADMLKHNDAVSEIRDWPPEDFRTLMDKNGQLILNRRQDYESMKDLHNGYFPAPWAMLPNNALNDVSYSNIPRMVYGADPSLEWHPYLCFSNEEKEMVKEFCSNLPHSKTIMLETQLRSAGNFNLGEGVIKNIMALCRAKFGQCNFIFASMMDHTKYVDDVGVVSASHFTVRQTALVHNYCDLFIGVCSGITMAASCWGNKPVPRVEMCGSMIQSSIIANGPVTSFICDNMSLETMNRGFENKIAEVLNKF